MSATLDHCPCCGHAVSARDPRTLLWAALTSPKERALGETLAASFGAWVPTEEVLEQVYGDDRPRSARRCLRVFAFIARGKLASVGLTIKGRHEGGYRLEWLTQ